MRPVVTTLFALSFASSVASGAQIIKLKPGATIEIKPDNDTIVICERDQESLPKPTSYCKCEWRTLSKENNITNKGYALVRVVFWSDGKKFEDEVVSFEQDKKGCEAAVANHPACK